MFAPSSLQMNSTYAHLLTRIHSFILVLVRTEHLLMLNPGRGVGAAETYQFPAATLEELTKWVADSNGSTPQLAWKGQLWKDEGRAVLWEHRT